MDYYIFYDHLIVFVRIHVLHMELDSFPLGIRFLERFPGICMFWFHLLRYWLVLYFGCGYLNVSTSIGFSYAT